MKRLLFLALLLASPAQATIHIFDNDSLPKTLSTAYTDDTIRISGTSITTATTGLKINGNRITLECQGDTIFYGTGGGNGNYAIDFTSAGDTFKCYDCTFIHDPQNDGNNGEWDDTSFNGTENTPVTWDNGGSGSSPIHCEFQQCNMRVYGNDTRCMDTYGNAVGTRNVIIDSCHLWNMSDSYPSRHSYGGAGIRFEQRGTFSAGQFTAHITNTVVHRSPHIAIAVIGKATVSQFSPGTIISYCSTYVDAVNTDGGANGTEDNAYGISLKDLGPPLQCDHNLISNGTVRAGSRGLLLENIVCSSTDTAKIYNNLITATSGPTEENPPGVTRSVRIRGIDGNGAVDYLHFYDNVIEVLTDTLDATTHIGANASGLQFGVDAGDNGKAHLIIERNRCTYRPMTEGTDGNAAEYSVGSDFSGTPPIVVRQNKYISGDRIVWFADEFNAVSCKNLTLFEDTLSFLPAGDSGMNLSDQITWRVGYYAEPSVNVIGMNAYYDTTTDARDTNIVLHTSNTHEFTLVQRINISAIGIDDSLVASSGFKVTNNYGQVVLNAGSIAAGDTLFDFRYWKTYGNSGGTDSNFNPFDVWVWSGSDTTKLTDTVIDWQATCLPVRLASTSGTLDASDTCAAVADVCVSITQNSPTNGQTITDDTPTLDMDFADTDGDTATVVLIFEDADATPEDTLADTVLVMDDDWLYTTGTLTEDHTYYWKAIACDTAGCCDTSAIFSFTLDAVGTSSSLRIYQTTLGQGTFYCRDKDEE